MNDINVISPGKSETAPATNAITVISSMATRQVLARLCSDYERLYRQRVVVESMGGVDAARCIRAGQAFDLAVLASDAIDRLTSSGHLLAAQRTGLARSKVAIAVAAQAQLPDVGSAAAVREAILAARTIAYSTGPSGKHLMALFDSWRIADAIKERLMQAPPGVPVATLIARGEATLGFQQLSELMDAPGIRVLGTLPAEIEFITTFSAAISSASEHRVAALGLLDFLRSPLAQAAKLDHGMEPVAS